MKTTLEKYTAKAAASLEKMTERTACAGYCNTASGLLFTDKEGRALYTLPGYSVTQAQMPNGCREMPALEKLLKDFSALHSVPAEKAVAGTLADGKKGLAVVRFYTEDGRHATVNKKLLSYFPAEAFYRVTSDRQPVLVYDGEDLENLLGAVLPILCTRGGSDNFRPAEEKPAEEKPRRLSRLAKIEPAAEEKPEAAPAAEPEAESIPAADMPAEAPEKAAEAAEEPKAEETPAEAEKAEEKAAAASYTVNEEKSGIEISFPGKPSEAIRDDLKKAGFRWHKVRRVWYAKQTAERIALVQSLTGEAVQAPEAKAQPKKAQAGRIDLAGIEDNKKTEYGADFARVLRDDLKRRGASGFSIRSRRSGYTDAFTLTISLSSADFRSAEECAARDGWSAFFRAEETGCKVDGVEYSRWNQGREDATHKYISCGSNYTDTGADSNFHVLRAFWADKIKRISGAYSSRLDAESLLPLTEEAAQRVRDIVAVVESYNWDRSDPMTDYYDVGFYLDIDFKRPADFEPREYMTAEERAQLENDLAAEAAAQAARLEEYRRQREEEAEAAKKAEEQERADLAQIAEAVTVEDLPAEKQYFIRGLSAGIGKECSLDELCDGIRSTVDAKISRRVTFSSEKAFEAFGRRLLCDFEFVAGMGGTATDDARVTDSNYNHLTREQREAVKFYACECVAVYCGGLLRLVVNPEGYNYCRYCYLPGAETREETPEESAAATAAEEAKTAALDPFFFPAPVADQLGALPVGEVVTVYRENEWTLQNTAFCGILTAAEPGNYAQYSGVYLTIKRGGKADRIFCRNGLETVIFSGLPCSLPDSVKYASVKASGGATIAECRSQEEEMRQIIRFYAEMGRKPIFDTVQR